VVVVMLALAFNCWVQISLWDLRPLTASMSSTPMQPVAVTPVPAGDMQLHVCYNPDDITELLSNGARRAYFWKSQLPGTTQLSYYSPPLRASDFHQAVGNYVTSVFVPGSKQVGVARAVPPAVQASRCILSC